jgi:hypothetical protein
MMHNGRFNGAAADLKAIRTGAGFVERPCFLLASILGGLTPLI